MSRAGTVALLAAFILTLPLPAGAATPADWLNPVSGTWHDPAKWSTNPDYPNNGTPAGTTYQALVDATGAAYAISVTRNTTVDSLTLDSPDATVALANAVTLHTDLVDLRRGTFDLAGGILQGARVQGPGTLKLLGTVDNATLAVPSITTGGFYVRNTLTLDGTTVRLAGPSSPGLTMFGPAALAGTGRIIFDGTRDGAVGDNHLTIGPGISIETGTRGGTIGGEGADVVNRGTILANAARTLVLVGNWQNQGLIRLEQGTLELRSDLTMATLGRVEHTGGTLILTRRLDLGGGVLDLETSLGTLTLSGDRSGVYFRTGVGVLANGTIRSSGAATLIPDAAGFENVTLDTDVRTERSADFSAVGLTLNNRRLTFMAGANIVAETIGGTGEIVIGDRFNGTVLTRISAGDHALVLGPGITLRTGEMSAPTSGSLIKIGGVEVGFRNEGTLVFDKPNTDVEIFGDWSNTGTIKLSAGRLNLGGRFTLAGMGNLERTGGEVVLTGELDATGRTLRLDARTGGWELGERGSLTNATRIIGARVETADGVRLTVRSDAVAALERVTLAAPLALDRHATLRVIDRLTLDHVAISMTGDSPFTGRQTLLDLAGLATIDGTGEIVFNAGPKPNVIRTNDNAGPVTFGPGVTLRSGSGGASVTAAAGAPITVQGNVMAGGGDRAIVFAGPITLTGRVLVEADGAVSLPGLTNLSGGTLTGGVLELNARAKVQLPGPIRVNAATIRLDGPGSLLYYDTQAATDALDTLERNAAGGTLAVTGGRALALSGALTNQGMLLIGGALSSAGDFAQDQGGEMRFQIGGVDAGAFGRLAAGGNLAADGVLGVDLVNGYIPSAGAVFDVLDYAAYAGAFDSYDLPALPQGLAWDTSAVPTTGALAVVPEPTVPAMLAGVALLIPPRGRRRRGASTSRG